MQCHLVDASSEEELVYFLKRHEEFTLFLLSNLELYGYALSSALYSGNYKIIRSQGSIIAAFVLARSGSLLIHSTIHSHALFALVLSACQEEPIALIGMLGEWTICQAFWEWLKEKMIIREEQYVSKEILYTLSPKTLAPVADSDARLMTPDDFEEWNTLRIGYVAEMGFPQHELDEVYEEFLEKTERRITWGLFLDGKLVCIADLNACVFDLGQVGGVYTLPAFRKRGLCTRLMQKLIQDCHALHQIRKLIIFTGEKNMPARAVYESLGAQSFGHFALLFGKN